VLHSVHSSLEVYFILPTTRQAVTLDANLQKWPFLLETHIFHNFEYTLVFWYITCADRLGTTSIIDVWAG